MTTHPKEEQRPNGSQSLPAASERASGRKRKLRRKSAKPSQLTAMPEKDLDDLDFDDDDDDLELPSYGMRFDRSTAEKTDQVPRKAKPISALTQPVPAVKRPVAKPEIPSPPAERKQTKMPPHSASQPGGAKKPSARPQASQPPKPVRASRKPAGENPPVADKPRAGERPRREKLSVPQQPPAAQQPPVADRHPGAKPRREKPAPAARPRITEKPRRDTATAPQQMPVAETPTVERSLVAEERPAAKPRRERPPRERVAREDESTERARPVAPRTRAAHSEKFAALGLSEIMLDALAAATYQEPTPVQEGFIPRALQGVDVMGQAQTGTGKTAAFAIPILEMLQPQRRGSPPQALVLVPTRELAVQVRDECEKLSLGRIVSIVAVYGGKPIRKQIEQVNHGASFIVGTPGRVLDLMSRGALVWSGLRVVVLDEADRMLDIGFRPDIEKILRRCPASRQTLLLSATLAPPVKRLAERYMREPEVLDFSPKNLAVETIEQFYFTVDPERKFELLVKLLERENPKQAIIFCRTKRGTDKVCTKLSRHFQGVDTIHGDLQQSARDRVMKAFREERVRWLVATDVVGRGIDVTSISHIINFDIPQFCDDYVHRVGRTGRMGREGVAYTFVAPEEGGELTRIEIRINRLLIRDEIPGFQAFGDPRSADSVVLGDGPGNVDDDLVESAKPASRPVFGKPIRRVRRAL
jgi:ATP-dependent RNA helicase DeaD